MRDLFISSRGVSLVGVLVGLVISALVLFAGQSALKWATRADSQIQLSNELRELREDALRRIDCTRSVKDAPVCQLKDKRGNQWPNTTGTLGKFQIASSCQASGLIILYRAVKPIGEASESASLGVATNTATDWNPLFPEKGTMCESDVIAETATAPSALPYYQLVKSPNYIYRDVASRNCAYGDDNGVGWAIWGTAVCPLGYRAVSGGTDCGAQNGDAANQNAGSYFYASGAYTGYSTSCCAKNNIGAGFTYAVCIRE